ncbi:hypothetical protein L1049_019289 [Liquidambar formosana]|uniref:Uncharacterized protein n=1 Tax=Liquidambar formosana TaxID=63359 RepID=A0AAP0S7Z1_LIQFO
MSLVCYVLAHPHHISQILCDSCRFMAIWDWDCVIEFIVLFLPLSGFYSVLLSQLLALLLSKYILYPWRSLNSSCDVVLFLHILVVVVSYLFYPHIDIYIIFLMFGVIALESRRHFDTQTQNKIKFGCLG